MPATFDPATALVWYAGLLDRLPDFARAMLAGVLLVALLALSCRRIPRREVLFGLAFRKISLVVLVVIPLVVWLLPATRLTVFVDRLELSGTSASLVWQALLVGWGAGFVVAVVRLAGGYVRAAAAVKALPVLPDDDPLSQRLRHWQGRLSARTDTVLALATTGQPTHLAGLRRVVLPQAVTQWPRPAADVLIIQSVCRGLKHQSGWYLFAQLVACGYWPLPWVRGIGQGLLRGFHLHADSLAAACYQDDLGYPRALRQIQQRLGAPDAARGDAEPPARRLMSRLAAAPMAYVGHLLAFLRPDPGFPLNGQVLARAYDERRDALWSEPGEKLAVLIGQSLLVAMLLIGSTLREAPPVVERDYSITLDPKWMNTAFPRSARSSPSPPLQHRDWMPAGNGRPSAESDRDSKAQAL